MWLLGLMESQPFKFSGVNLQVIDGSGAESILTGQGTLFGV